MPHTLVADYTEHTRRKKHIILRDTLTGSYTAGGDPIDFTNIANPSFHAGVFPGAIPDRVYVKDIGGGYDAQVVPNPTAPATPTLANAYALKVWSSSGTELAAGAYPAALTALPITLDLEGGNWNL